MSNSDTISQSEKQRKNISLSLAVKDKHIKLFIELND